MENQPNPASEPTSASTSSNDQNTAGSGLIVLLNISLLALLAEAVLFLPFILLKEFFSWALIFIGFLGITRLNAAGMTAFKLTVFSGSAGIIVGLGPVTFMQVATVSQLFVVPSLLLVLSACSIALLRQCISAAVCFTTTGLLSFTLAMALLDDTLSLVWPASWLVMGLMIIWVGQHCAKQPS